ncbi:hypothetical protein LX77_02692 [Gelidibacter algens]|uniref:Lipocalin-like domain-containing protein n=1 Tax=Gelidibacter algens TaxID=49280 RepID=A0A1A7R8Y5_9FLAO|nr:lipocalin family protein [Gelidibacter algens]OBX27182.1 hypothetical protein A9996_00165 [Gelidibacter algens]RAJ22034.1 hypothetical protein LX77_02692 [Gelidibacter algens]
MKKLIFTLITVGILFSCNKNDDSNSNTELIGNWKLIEVLADPGDGNGTYSAVESEKIITFHSDGTLTSNGTLCDMSIEANNSTSGTYSISNLTFSTAVCNNSDYEYQLEQNGNILIITYPCIEPCKAKYTKE